MYSRYSSLAALSGLTLASTAFSARADPFKVNQKVLLPDGKPAIGANVLLRSLKPKDGTLLAEKRVRTDENGMVQAEIETGPITEMEHIRVTGYLMVDAPGMPLTFEKFSNLRSRDPEPLRLGTGYDVNGKALTKAGAPVPGAQILLGGFADPWNTWRVNWPAGGIVTPEASAIADTEGMYQMRPVDIVEQTYGNGPPAVRPLLLGKGTLEGATLLGSSETYAPRVGQTPPGSVPVRENGIRLLACDTVHGQVLDASSQKPVAGATVTLTSYPGDLTAAFIAPSQTDATGNYEFKDVPQSFQLFAIASHPDFAGGYVMIRERQRSFGADPARKFDPAPILLRPWAQASGHVIDVTDGKLPLTPVSISSVYQEGYNDGNLAVGRGVTATKANPDGTFTIKVPVGHNHLMVSGPGYREIGRDHPTDWDIKPGENPAQVLDVRREDGYLVHFTSDLAKGKPDFDYDREFDLMIRGKDGRESNTTPSEWWYWPLYKPDDTLEVRMTRSVDGFVEEVMPWTKLTPWKDAANNAEHWPRELFIPSRQTVSVSGKVYEPGTDTPLAGATVALVSRPQQATSKWKPVVTGADGSFSFENVPLPTEMIVKAVPPAAADGQVNALPAQLRVGAGILAALAVKTDEGRQDFTGLQLRPRPLVPVTIKLTDVETHQPLPFESSLQASYPAFTPLPTPPDVTRYDRPLFDTMSLSNTKIPAPGQGTAVLPAGEVKLELMPGNYRLANGPETVHVPSTGKPEIELKVVPLPAFRVKLVRDDPAALGPVKYWIEPVTPQAGVPKPSGVKYDWTLGDQKLLNFSAANWGDQMVLKIADEATGHELVSQTITADSKTWPTEIRLPVKK